MKYGGAASAVLRVSPTLTGMVGRPARSGSSVPASPARRSARERALHTLAAAALWRCGYGKWEFDVARATGAGLFTAERVHKMDGRRASTNRGDMRL